MRQPVLGFAAVALSLAWLSVFVWIATRDPIFAAAAYAALGDVTTLAALGAGIAAFVINFSPYRQWKRDQARSPRMAIATAIHRGSGRAQPALGDEVALDGLDIPLQIAIKNSGDAPLHNGVVTIAVLAECDIHPVELRPRDNHYLMKGVYGRRFMLPNSPDIEADVRMTVIERAFPPGEFVYEVGIRTPSPGEWPVLIAISGEPPPDLELRVKAWTGGIRPSSLLISRDD